MNVDIGVVEQELITLPETKLSKLHGSQFMLQGASATDSPFEGVGRIDKMKLYEDDYNVPIFDLPYINSLIAKYKMYRTRVMTLDPKKCYTYHQDPTYRVHIPVVTNTRSWLMIDEQLYKLSVGEAYVVNTKYMHTAINAHNLARTHIVGCISDEDAASLGVMDYTLSVRPVVKLLI